MTLKVIQDGMLTNSPGFVKGSVNEATEVLRGMLNTHRSTSEAEWRSRKNGNPTPLLRKYPFS